MYLYRFQAQQAHMATRAVRTYLAIGCVPGKLSPYNPVTVYLVLVFWGWRRYVYFEVYLCYFKYIK